MQKNNYTIYHVHSPYSNANAGMDCVTPIELTIGKAKRVWHDKFGVFRAWQRL